VTTGNDPDYLPPADRIATFDNDGTLWVEVPAPPQYDFQIRKWIQEAQKNPSLASEEPYKAILEQDKAFFEALAIQDPTVVASVQDAFARTWVGTTPDVFAAEVSQWIDTVRQPKFEVGYTKLVYKPMLELFDYLKAHDFRVFVCSGGGLDFMRVFSETVLGVAKENVIGTEAEYEYKDGKLMRTGQFLGGIALGPSKPTHIFSRTGRLPAFAAGNMDSDIEMCEVAKFAILINHDDHNREFEYTKGAEKVLVKAKELGWTIVSMKNDWKTVFA